VYVPDFKIFNEDGSFKYIEVKGFLDAASRIKMHLIKQQYPDMNVDFHFMRNNKVTPRSKQTYKDWAQKNGYQATVGIQSLRDYCAGLTTSEIPLRTKASME